ncbi:hypothetical protein AAEH76_21770, partial [Shewanella algae]|uniref:hypothetical protein n=1 Tax=Shewanella algae TaxID=38313 RepID=UPI00313EAA09
AQPIIASAPRKRPNSIAATIILLLRLTSAAIPGLSRYDLTMFRYRSACQAKFLLCSNLFTA